MSQELPPEIWFKIFEYLLHDTSEQSLPSSLFARVRVRLVFLKAVTVELNQMCKTFIKTIKKSGVERRPDLMEYLAKNKYNSCLIYMHEIGAKWTNYAIGAALSNNDFKIVKYAIDNGYSWEYKPCLRSAMSFNCLEAIKYFHEGGYKDWSDLTCTEIVERGSLECLKYAHERGCEFDESSCSTSARFGHLDCLKFIHENGGSWSDSTCDSAAKGGHVDCLKYALDNGCQCHSSAYTAAVESGHVDAMKYLYENTSVDWPRDICYVAAMHNQLDCLKYAYDHDAPFNDRTVVYGCQTTECLQFVHDAGYGWNDYWCEAKDKRSVLFSQYAHEQDWCKFCRFKK
jgi:hypothetical protein